MEPGIYRNMPESEYRAIDAVNQSALKYPTPLHMRHAMQSTKEPTPAMLFGRYVHVQALEPHEASKTYAVMPDLTKGILNKDGTPSKNPRNTAQYREAVADWTSRHKDKEVVSREVWFSAARAAEAVRSHEDAMHFIDNSDDCEIVAVWKDEATGLLCKARLDAICTAFGCVTDLKTCESAEPHKFAQSLFNFGYHLQAAHYINGARACGFDVDSFAIIAVERDAPHAVQVFELEAEAITYGQQVLAEKLSAYALAKQTGEWCGYPLGINSVTLPSWAWSRIRKEAHEWVR